MLCLHACLASAKFKELLLWAAFLHYSLISIVSLISPHVWGNIVITELFKDHYKQAFEAAWS